MPNECSNYITITCDNMDELSTLVQTEFQHIENNDLVYNDRVRMVKRGKKGIIVDVETAWTPDFDWLESLLSSYPNCWIKNEWHEEGGIAGVWVGSVKNNEPSVQSMTWEDLCIESRHFMFLDDSTEIDCKPCENNEQEQSTEQASVLLQIPMTNKIYLHNETEMFDVNNNMYFIRNTSNESTDDRCDGCRRLNEYCKCGDFV